MYQNICYQFTFTFKNKSCYFSHSNKFYGSGKLINGLNIVELRQEMLTIKNKKPKV